MTSGPTQLNVVVTTNNAGTFTTTTISIPIPAALQNLDSTTPGATQSGFSSVSELVRSILRQGGFTDNKGSWWPSTVIQSITAQ